VIQQDRSVGKGGLVWDAGYILADYLVKHPQVTLLQDRPQKVVELGAGTGITGLLTAQAYPMAQVHMTDLLQLQPLLETNTLRSNLQNVTTGVLEWGKPYPDTFDVILAADVIAGIYDGQALIKSLYDLANSQTQIFLSSNEGRLAGIIDEVIEQLKERFSTVERRQPHSDNQNPNITVFCISGKRQFQ
jgi:predicted nicotinamide N-methyase